jgi:hypothetical protein
MNLILVKCLVEGVCTPLTDECDAYPGEPVIQVRSAHPSVGISGVIEEVPQCQTLSVDDLTWLIEGADKYATDLASGLEDGTYEDDDGLDEIEAAITRARAFLIQEMKDG